MSDDPSIAAHQGDFLDFGLCNEQAVERIALAFAAELDIGKATIGDRVSYGDGQESKPLRQKLLGPLLGNLELAKRCFDRDLEKRARAEEWFLRTGDRLACGIRQTSIVPQPPEHRMRVGKEPQSTIPRP